MRIGLLTGGGDCPGLNALIRAVVKQGSIHGHSLVGFRHGWRGVVDGDLFPLTRDHVRGVLPLGGTMLGTARFHPHEDNGGIDAVLETLKHEHIDALICVGGDGTLHAAGKLAAAGVGMVCAPKTIDNDVWGTDRSVGFDTAVSIATEAIDRVHTTAESHDRVMVVEVMGHHVGWIAVAAGIAGGADMILIPEDPFDIDDIAARLRHRHRSYASSSIVVVAEGATARPGTLDFVAPEGPYGSIVAGAMGERIKIELQERTGFDTRVTILGHTQRGGTPTATDRLLASRFGVAAADAVDAGATSVMTALVGDEIKLVDIAEVAGRLKEVPEDLRRVAESLY
ncbi:MAG: ATP-dependent 6-phosphofructokinase [Actinobacteria bacterium]|nr:ATP-dependent 6-phosphofructokinase [Actinomycetota bacterium]